MGFLFGGIAVGVIVFPVFMAAGRRKKYRKNCCFPVPRGMGWLQITAIWMLEHLPQFVRRSELMKGYAELAADKLYPGIKKETFCRRHQVKKMMLLYGSIVVGSLVLMVYSFMNRSLVLTEGCIQREDARGNSRSITVEAAIEGADEKQELVLTVNPRQYTAEEREALMNDIRTYIDKVLPGDNISLQQVNSPLCFPETFPGENITIEWQPEDYNLIHQDGTLGDLEMYSLPIKTSVTAIIHYDCYEVRYEKQLCIIGIKQTDRESLKEQLMEALKKADKDSLESLQLRLPERINGHAVVWRYHRDSMLPGLAAAVLCIIVCLFFYQEERLKRQVQIRNNQLVYDYPGFVHRMVLMLGAGMTVRRSWEQLLKDYEKGGVENQAGRWLYREMRYARIQMQSGMPETLVYLEFGRRTELPQYMKFSQLLQQYIRRGSRGMQEIMLQEACEAEKQRRDLARRLGETAGTKLLMPMMFLLIIVLMIIMVPAFLSM